MNNPGYFTFYLAARFGVTGQGAQLALFAFLAAEVVGVTLGGPLCDRLGTRRVIQLSFWGTLPFALILPHVGLALTMPLAMLAGGASPLPSPPSWSMRRR